jgi:hypothetical protein
VSTFPYQLKKYVVRERLDTICKLLENYSVAWGLAYPDLAGFLDHLHLLLVVAVLGDWGVVGEEVESILHRRRSQNINSQTRKGALNWGMSSLQ